MPARTGAEYIEGLRARPPDLWIEGQRVADVTRHPAFRNVIRSLATLYDMQQDPALREEMTYVSPSSGQRVGLSFLVPRSREDLARVRAMMKRWADYSGGMLATLPIADEIMVFPSTLLKATDEDRPYAFAFAIPTATKGLRFICRETFDLNGTPFDHPLGARFEEMDAVVIFDDVLVPWERVFLLRDVERCNKAFGATNAVVHMAHQVVTKNVAKTEFVLGIASLIVDAIAIEQFQHVQGKIAEITYYLETMKAFLRASEVEAQVGKWGMITPAWPPLDAARNMFTWMYPRTIEKYYQAARLNATDRIKLFRLAWDLALSSFGSRQVIYERFFFGDPVRMQMATFANYDRREVMERVRAFLNRPDAAASLESAATRSREPLPTSE